MKRVLNAGAGYPGYIPEGFTTNEWVIVKLDLDPRTKPDIVGDVRHVPEPDGSFDAVYCSQVLEHLPFHDVVPTLREFRRLINDDGFIVVVVPNLAIACRLVAQGDGERQLIQTDAGPVTALDMIFGHRPSIQIGHPLMAHQCGFTQDSLYNVLQSAGFAAVDTRQGENVNLYGVARAKAIGRGPTSTGQTIGIEAKV
jgi:hypothetical protein